MFYCIPDNSPSIRSVHTSPLNCFSASSWWEIHSSTLGTGLITTYFCTYHMGSNFQLVCRSHRQWFSGGHKSLHCTKLTDFSVALLHVNSIILFQGHCSITSDFTALDVEDCVRYTVGVHLEFANASLLWKGGSKLAPTAQAGQTAPVIDYGCTHFSLASTIE